MKTGIRRPGTPRRGWVVGAAAAVLALVFVALFVVAASAFLTPTMPWLSIKGVGTEDTATAYYTNIGAPATLADWKARYGFDGSDETTATYYNSADLGFGREMHCRRFTETDVACYVVNHGFGPASPQRRAVNDAVEGTRVLATVAMVSTAADHGVDFFAYDGAGNLITKVPLDSQGPKYLPQMCTACHGGLFHTDTSTVTGASFLPFDLGSFMFSPRPGFTRSDQEESFRKLNALVRATDPASPITELVDCSYAAGGGVDQPGSTWSDDGCRPVAFQADAGTQALYDTVVKKYCRTCHIAQQRPPLSTPGQLTGARNAVFDGFYMPHAERTFHLFWQTGAPAYLAASEGWSFRVTRLDDPAPDGCNPGDCSLREAVIAANAVTGSPRPIITFDVDGTFTLTRPDGATDEDQAKRGDLDIRRDMLILGNGADRTILDGDGFFRVIQVIGALDVGISGVTIEKGGPQFDPSSLEGGGILLGRDLGSRDSCRSGGLTLRSSVVTRNTASAGGGIALQCDAPSRLTVEDSTIGPGNRATAGDGGGIDNEGGAIVIRNSTIAGNDASGQGGGVASRSSPVVLANDTVAFNQAGTTGGGISSSDGASLEANIVVGNTAPDEADCALGGSLILLGYDLTGSNGNANGCPTIGPTDLVLAGDVGTAIEQQLSGTIPAYQPAVDSPAVDAVPLGRSGCVPPSYDQWDVARPHDGARSPERVFACDIGAVELAKPPPPNLLRNSDFELDAENDGRPNHWSSNRRFLRVETDSRVSGRYIGEFHATDNTGAVVGQTVAAEPNTIYLFTRWVRIPTTSDRFSLEFRVTWLNASGFAIGSKTESIDADTGGAWTLLRSPFLSITGTVRARIDMVVKSLNGTIDVDHFSWRGPPKG